MLCLTLKNILPLILPDIDLSKILIAGLKNVESFADLNAESGLCCVTSSPLILFVSDPTVSRYHVQWMPEYCSHNETRGPEKSVTQVSLQPPFHTTHDHNECSAQSMQGLFSSPVP